MLDQFPSFLKPIPIVPSFPALRQEDMVEDRQDHWPLQVYMLARKPWWKDGEFVGDGRDGVWICQVSRRWMNSSKSHSHVLSKHPCFNDYHFLERSMSSMSCPDSFLHTLGTCHQQVKKSDFFPKTSTCPSYYFLHVSPNSKSMLYQHVLF